MRICLIQCDPSSGRQNLAVLNDVVAKTDADLYVLPELFACGYPPPNTATAEEFVEGRLYWEVTALQMNRPRSGIIYGFWETDNGRSYNSAGVIADVGAAEVYRQRCPADASLLPGVPGAWYTVTIGAAREEQHAC